MSSYYPPTEDINVFNTALFTNEPDAISQGSASLLYLSKVSTDTSTAPLTTFTGNTTFSNLPNSSAVPSSANNLVNKNYVVVFNNSVSIGNLSNHCWYGKLRRFNLFTKYNRIKIIFK